MKKVYSYFELNESLESIYRYSPVFKTMIDSKDVIIKRTKKDRSEIENLFAWTEKLEAKGISVVRPISYKGKKYKSIDDNNWVVYPFINGRKYNGSFDDIYKAGVMLGKIHALKLPKCIFKHGFSWDEYDEEFINDVKTDIKDLIDKYKDDENIDSFINLSEGMNHMVDGGFENLKRISIPYVDGVWDYKANNLIYSGDKIVLIDPDNGGNIPRIFDLALALILFHMEMETAPDRMFTIEEWEKFKEGYLDYVTLTDSEKKIWSEFLLFVYIDEALWAMSDLEDSETERQKKFIRSLLSFDPKLYEL